MMGQKWSSYMFIDFFFFEKKKNEGYLATQRAEGEGIKEAAVADMAGIGNTFAQPRLWSFIQEHYPGTVYYVCLNPCYVYQFLNL